MPQQLPNIPDPILNHRRSLQTKSPPINPQIRRQAHRLQHLGSEHAAIANLDPLIQSLMEAEDLHARFRIGIVSGLEAQVADTHFREEDLHEADEAAQSQAVIGNDAFDLVELGEVGGVDGLVAEDAVDGEVARGAGIGGEFVEDVG